MCGRFAMSEETDDLVREFVAQGGDLRDRRGVYSAAPPQQAPTVREWTDEHGDAHREVTLAKWDWPKPASMP